MLTMTDTTQASQRPVRDAADAYVDRLAELNPILATSLGFAVGQDRLPDLSPAGEQAEDELRIATLARLAEVERAAEPGFADADERRCARLLRERLETEHAISQTGEHLRAVSNIFGPPQRVRGTFLLMPTATTDDWAVIARRISAVPAALASYRESLAEGARRGLYAAPRQVETVAGQLTEWGDWFAGFAASGPDELRSDLDRASAAADAAVAGLRDWLVGAYLPKAEGTPDGVGAERYQLGARRWNGTRLDLQEAYEWGWSQYREIVAQMETEAAKILPGGSVRETMEHLDQHGEVIEGVEQIRVRLQGLMDEAIANLDGTHFDLADPVKVV